MHGHTELIALALGFIAYAGLHSWLASQRCKDWVGRRWPPLLPAYRLLYNLLALLTLVPILALLWQWEGALIWQRPPWLAWLGDALALLALAAFVHSLGGYDLGLFSGSRQWRERHRGAPRPDGNEGFRIGLWHRFVRHPWYCFGLVILWTRDMNAAQLLFYALVSGYLLLGSRLEERKLLARYGAAYGAYQRRVPGLLPRPWRWLSAAEAAALQRAQ